MPPGAPGRLSLIFILESLIARQEVLVRGPATTRYPAKEGVNIERIAPVGPALARIIPFYNYNYNYSAFRANVSAKYDFLKNVQLSV